MANALQPIGLDCSLSFLKAYSSWGSVEFLAQMPDFHIQQAAIHLQEEMITTLSMMSSVQD